MVDVHRHVCEMHLFVEKCPATGGIRALIMLRWTRDSRAVGRLREYRFISPLGARWRSLLPNVIPTTERHVVPAGPTEDAPREGGALPDPSFTPEKQ